MKKLLFVSLIALCMFSCTKENNTIDLLVSVGNISNNSEVPATVEFKNTTPNADEYSWIWEFGDGKKGFGPSHQHEYKAAGTYQVQVTARKDGDLVGDKTISVTINQASNKAPEPTLYVIHQSKIGLVKFKFNAQDEGGKLSYKLDLGTNTKTFNTAGEYDFTFTTFGEKTVTLTVTDEEGLSKTITETVLIDHPSNLFPTKVGTQWTYNVYAYDNYYKKEESGQVKMTLTAFNNNPTLYDERITLRLTGKLKYLSSAAVFGDEIILRVKKSAVTGEYNELQKYTYKGWRTVFRKGVSSWSGLNMLLATNKTIDTSVRPGYYTADVPYGSNIRVLGYKYHVSNRTQQNVTEHYEYNHQEYYDIDNAKGLIYGYSSTYYNDRFCSTCRPYSDWFEVSLVSFKN